RTSLAILETIPVLLVIATLIFLFFFSSRRRHTRFSRDWSSDVCSSDLHAVHLTMPGRGRQRHGIEIVAHQLLAELHGFGTVHIEIGRASCRERVYMPVVGGSVQNKK